MTLNVISRSRCFGGTQFTYQHKSSETGTMMRFAAFVPPQSHRVPFPVVWYLSGLTCTEENFTVKAGAQRIAAELGLLLIAPDTSPRGDEVPSDPAGSFDFGLGAGFYVDATQQPWSRNYRMGSYIERELPNLINSELPADGARQSIMGHSMGGHGALTIAASQQKASLFDHLVGACEQRDGESEAPSVLAVLRLDLNGLLERQASGFGALEDFIPVPYQIDFAM